MELYTGVNVNAVSGKQCMIMATKVMAVLMVMMMVMVMMTVMVMMMVMMMALTKMMTDMMERLCSLGG